MDRRDRRDREPRVREVAEREEARGSLRPEVPAREPEHGKRAERDDDDLREPERRAATARRIQAGASRTRNGSTWPPSRTICSPVAPCVTSSGRPSVVLHTACTMLPEVEAPDPEAHEAARGRRRRARPTRRPSRPTRRSATERSRTGRDGRGRRGALARNRAELVTAVHRRGRGRGLRRESRESTTAREPTVTAAIASVAAVSNGVGCPLPGVTTIASGTNQTSDEPRSRERDDDERAARSSAATRSA